MIDPVQRGSVPLRVRCSSDSVFGDSRKLQQNIAIIIPTHNRSHCLARTMPFYLAQKGISEIVIVDDASLDATESYIHHLIEQSRKIRYVRHSTRRGPSAARNTGIDHISADSRYLLFGEDDAILEENYSAKLLRKLERFDCDIAGGRVLSIGMSETFEECLGRHNQYLAYMKRCGQYPTLIDQKYVLGNWTLDTIEPALFLHSCALFRREVLEAVRFDENYKGNYFREETDIYLGARMKGFRALFVGDAVCFHLRSTSGGTFDYGFRLGGALSMFLEKVGVPSTIYSFLNNNYFLNKYYEYLRKEFGYTHNREYYKRAFVSSLLKSLLKSELRGATGLVGRMLGV